MNYFICCSLLCLNMHYFFLCPPCKQNSSTINGNVLYCIVNMIVLSKVVQQKGFDKKKSQVISQVHLFLLLCLELSHFNSNKTTEWSPHSITQLNLNSNVHRSETAEIAVCVCVFPQCAVKEKLRRSSAVYDSELLEEKKSLTV